MAESSDTMDIIVRLRDRASKGVKELRKEIKILPIVTRAASRGVNNLKNSLNTFRLGIGKVQGALFGLKGLVATVGLGLLSRSFIQAASTAEQYRTRLEVLLGSQKEGNRLFKEMADYASGVSFEYEQVMGSATALAGVMEEGVDEIVKWMPMIGDLAAAAGMGIEDTTSQIIRMYSAGAASADMFRERGILAMLGFQAGVSYSAAETRKRLIEAWEDPLSKFRGASVKLAQTWGGLLSMMSDAWFQFRTMVMEAGVFDFMKAGVASLLNYLRDLRERGDLEKWANSLSDTVVDGLKKIILHAGGVADVFLGWRMVWEILKISFARFAPFLLQTLGVLARVVGGIAVLFLAISDAMGMEGTAGKAKQLLDLMEDINDTARDSRDYWKGIAESSKDNLKTLAKQESYYTKTALIIDAINKKVAEWKDKEKEDDVARPRRKEGLGVAKPAIRLAAELSEFKAHQQTILKELGIFYKEGMVDFDNYWSERHELLLQAFVKEKQILQSQRAAAVEEKKPDKVRQINAKIYSLEEKHKRDLMQLDTDEVMNRKQIADKKLLIDQTLADIRERASIANQQGLTAAFQTELAELQKRQEDEITLLTGHNATKEQLNNAHRSHELEKEKLLADQKKRLMDATLQDAKSALGFMGEAFGDMYEATGKKHKSWAKAQRATQIAMAIITTYEAAISAYKSTAAIPIIGPAMAPIAAAIAIAAGMAKVAAMRAQPLAKGGMVKGHSPTPTSDNIPIDATAGEFMQPVSAVRKYGLGVMEAIRQGRVPAETLSVYSLKGFKVPSGRQLGEGGVVSSSVKKYAPISEMEREEREITIINVIDPNEFDTYLASPSGQNAVLNIISSNQDRIQRVRR